MDKFTENLVGGIRRVAMAGVGAVSITIEKSGKLFEHLAARGEEAAAGSQAACEDIQKKVTENLEAFSEKLRQDRESASFESLLKKCQALSPEQREALIACLTAPGPEPEPETGSEPESEPEPAAEQEAAQKEEPQAAGAEAPDDEAARETAECAAGQPDARTADAPSESPAGQPAAQPSEAPGNETDISVSFEGSEPTILQKNTASACDPASGAFIDSTGNADADPPEAAPPASESE